MKPNTQTTRQSDRLGRERSSFSPGHPLIDYQFRTSLSEGELGGAGSDHKQTRPALGRGFRALSDKFLSTEAKQDYVIEALFFGIIVAISAWPIVSMIRALAGLVK